jgi:hypothetical protein
MWLSAGVSVLRKSGANYEVVERLNMLADEIYQAIAIRGARVGEIVEAIKKVRAGGSIIDDLPSTSHERPLAKRARDD